MEQVHDGGIIENYSPETGEQDQVFARRPSYLNEKEVWLPFRVDTGSENGRPTRLGETSISADDLTEVD